MAADPGDEVDDATVDRYLTEHFRVEAPGSAERHDERDDPEAAIAAAYMRLHFPRSGGSRV